MTNWWEEARYGALQALSAIDYTDVSGNLFEWVGWYLLGEHPTSIQTGTTNPTAYGVLSNGPIEGVETWDDNTTKAIRPAAPEGELEIVLVMEKNAGQKVRRFSALWKLTLDVIKQSAVGATFRDQQFRPPTAPTIEGVVPEGFQAELGVLPFIS